MSDAVMQPVSQDVRWDRPTVAASGDRIARSISRFPARWFFALTLLYLVTFFSLSYLKLLWLDELITLHIARLPSVLAIWHALGEGADPNPPITHVLVHASRLVFGEHEYALRLPAMVGYWLGMLSLFAYLRTRVPAVWALMGTVLSMTMAAFDYSFESRSYAIFYGFAMAAFYCWTISVDLARPSRTRELALGGMALALIAGISTNYFAVLAFLPIMGGEIVRTVHTMRRQRFLNDTGEPATGMSFVSVRVWGALLFSAASLLLYRSRIEHSIAQFAPHAWNKVTIDQAFDSYTEMVETILFPLLILFLFALCVRAFSAMYADCGNVRPGWLHNIIQHHRSLESLLPRHEATGVFLLMLYPFLGYVVASVRGGMLSPRFVIPVCFGFAIAGAVIAYRLFGRLPHAGSVLLCFCVAWFIARESVVGYWYEEQKQCFYKVLDRIPLADTYLPNSNSSLAVPDPLMVLTLQHYAPKTIADRIVFPIDFPAVREFRHDDSPEQNIWAGRTTLYSLRVMPLATFQQTTGKYLILASDANWLLQDLDRHHYMETRLPINTRAGAIGGFTPLSHGSPAFYIAAGGQTPTGPLVPEGLPIPFKVNENLPDASEMK